MDVHRNRLTQLATLGAALTCVAGAVAARPAEPTLSHARVCALMFFGDARWNYQRNECFRDERRGLEAAGEYACSVRYQAPRAMSFRARLLYENRLQRSVRATVHGAGTQQIAIGFAALREDDPGVTLPGGSYACEFVLGSQRRLIRFRSPGPRAQVLAPLACPTSTTFERACNYSDGEQAIHPPTRSMTCSAIFARLQGHRVEIHFLREGTLIYSGRDTLRYPITSEWAHTSATTAETMPAGSYLCRFLLDGRLVAEKTFALTDSQP